MSYFKICPHCGDRLDPGERCECQEQERQTEEFWNKQLQIGLGGQYTLKLYKEQKK